MPLTTSTDLFKKAYTGQYAIGAFNVSNLETVQGITGAAEELRSPVILQVLFSVYQQIGPRYFKYMLQSAIEESTIPICLHLDHGASFEICRSCVDAGFTSVMIDGSALPFEQNIALTKKVSDYAHERGVVVEAELGSINGAEGAEKNSDGAVYTDPEQAAEFVERSGCDSLAVSIGTSHGAYKCNLEGGTQLQFFILQKIAQAIPQVPLVLHGASSVPQKLVEKTNRYGGAIMGASGIPEEQLKKAAAMAICKINVNTDLLLAMLSYLREYLSVHPECFDYAQYFAPSKECVKEVVKYKMEHVFMSAYQAANE